MKGNAARREGQRGTPRHPKKQAVFLRLRQHRLEPAQASVYAPASIFRREDICCWFVAATRRAVGTEKRGVGVWRTSARDGYQRDS